MAILFFMTYISSSYDTLDKVTIISLSILLILIIAISYILSTDSYSIIPGEMLVIHKVIGNIMIPCNNIQHIDIIHPNILWLSIRTFGSGGLFGYFGYFYNKEYGRMQWYATQRKNCLVLITNNGKKILITPDDMMGLLQQLPQEKINDKRIV